MGLNMQIRPYLTFKGECQEAIELYKRAFKIEKAEIMRFSDMPPDPENPMKIPDSQKNWILHATLPFGDNFIRMSDTFRELNDTPTERLSIVVESNLDLVNHAFTVLSEEGNISMPLQKTFFSPIYGVVHDNYGIMWTFAGIPED